MRVALRAASLAEVLPLRHTVLRPGRPLSAAEFDGDHDPDTHHFGAFLADEDADDATIVGCASFMLQPWADAAAYQLRGMATRPDLAGGGIGTRLLAYAIDVLGREAGPRLLWCNARLAAVGFYRRLGWTIATEVFDIPDVGPHHVMTRRLPS